MVAEPYDVSFDAAAPVTGAAAPPLAGGVAVVMSWMDERRLSLFMLLSLMKYFCACDATCVGVRLMTKLRLDTRGRAHAVVSQPVHDGVYRPGACREQHRR